jgi:hypothetical protein
MVRGQTSTSWAVPTYARCPSEETQRRLPSRLKPVGSVALSDRK